MQKTGLILLVSFVLFVSFVVQSPLKFRNRRAFVTTLTDESAIAAEAIVCERSRAAMNHLPGKLFRL
jgi:hypothetical protein